MTTYEKNMRVNPMELKAGDIVKCCPQVANIINVNLRINTDFCLFMVKRGNYEVRIFENK
jgi:hypothetical protein